MSADCRLRLPAAAGAEAELELDMVDNKNIRGPQDPRQINIHEPYEVEYWTKKWKITPDQLKNAVKIVGTSTKMVAAYLGKPL
jgi:hypothetical protein